MVHARSIPVVSDDALVIPEIGPWAEDKYRLIALYDELFSKGMKDEWGKRVYIDLYSGAGFGRVKGTDSTFMGSPLIALNVEYPFDRYIFCEQKPELLNALREAISLNYRRNRHCPQVPGERTRKMVGRALGAGDSSSIQRHSGRHASLTGRIQELISAILPF